MHNIFTCMLFIYLYYIYILLITYSYPDAKDREDKDFPKNGPTQILIEFCDSLLPHHNC